MSPYKLIDYLNNRCTPGEAQDVEQWIIDNIDSPELDEVMLQMLAQCSDELSRPRLEAAWRQVMRRCRSSRRADLLRRAKRWIGAVAAVITLLFAGYGIYSLVSPAQVGGADYMASNAEFVQVHAQRGESRSILLPDSSLVVLKPGSLIVYDARNFCNHRELFLSGDLTAEVTHNPEKPLTVRCDGASVQVLGTKFNIQSHADDSRFEVVLYDGSVKVNTNFAERPDSAMLVPGQILKIDKQTGRSSLFNVEGLSTSPLATDLFFIDDELGDIVNRLGRLFDMRVLLRNPALARQRFFAIYVNGESLDEILNSLNSSNRMKITYTDSNTVEIR